MTKVKRKTKWFKIVSEFKFPVPQLLCCSLNYGLQVPSHKQLSICCILMWSLGLGEYKAVTAVSDCCFKVPCIFPLVARLYWEFHVSLTFSFSLCLSRFSISLICLQHVTEKCESTPEIILQQVNSMSDVNKFRKGQTDRCFYFYF